MQERKVQPDLFCYVATEKFVETAFRHEQRLGAMCLFIQEAANNHNASTMLPQLVIDYAKPGSHLCQCSSCASDLTTTLKE